MQSATRQVLDRLVGPVAPARGSLSVFEESRLTAALHDAWVAGSIPGFPGNEDELAAASRWLFRVDELEALGRALRLAREQETKRSRAT